MISSLGLTLCPPKQVWAISQGAADIITQGIETFGPMVRDYLSPKDESEPTGNPPEVSPAPPGTIDPCLDPHNADICGGFTGTIDPCANPGANPGISDLCGGSQPDTLPYGSNALPYDPLLLMKQYWGNFEDQLSYLAPEDQAAVLSGYRAMIEQGLAPYSPEQQQEAIQMLQQTMSPELSAVLLPT